MKRRAGAGPTTYRNLSDRLFALMCLVLSAQRTPIGARSLTPMDCRRQSVFHLDNEQASSAKTMTQHRIHLTRWLLSCGSTGEECGMDDAIVNVTGTIDRYFFSLGFIITIVFSGLKIFGIVFWPWMWITSPVWIWVILTFLRSQFIVRPSLKKSKIAEKKDK